MPEATNQQMQRFCDERIRPAAEQFRGLVASIRDHLAAITDEYARANGVTPWLDARTDGPPKLLASQDLLVFNAYATLFLKCVDGTATTGDVSDMHGNLAVFQSACVRPIGA